MTLFYLLTRPDGNFSTVSFPSPEPYSPSRTVAMWRMPVPYGSSAAV